MGCATITVAGTAILLLKIILEMPATRAIKRRMSVAIGAMLIIGSGLGLSTSASQRAMMTNPAGPIILALTANPMQRGRTMKTHLAAAMIFLESANGAKDRDDFGKKDDTKKNADQEKEPAEDEPSDEAIRYAEEELAKAKDALRKKQGMLRLMMAIPQKTRVATFQAIRDSGNADEENSMEVYEALVRVSMRLKVPLRGGSAEHITDWDEWNARLAIQWQRVLERELAMATTTAPHPPRQVVLIALDDVPRNLLTAYGATHGLSPHLDSIAHDGVTFSNARGCFATWS